MDGADQTHLVKDGVKELSPREKLALSLRYPGPGPRNPYRVVAAALDVSNNRARQIVVAAEQKLADYPMEEKFRFLVKWWHEETGHLSSPADLVTHVAYQYIIHMGPAGIPYILQEIRDNGGAWYTAIRLLDNNTPEISQDIAKSTQLVIHTWERWGREQGYLHEQMNTGDSLVSRV